MRKLSRRTLLGMTTAVFASAPALGAELKDPEIFADVNGHAIKGYDTVAYHLDRKAVKGSTDFAYEWKDATWLFSTAANRDRFAADPERWAPQYGGYCAWAIARDRTAPINPQIFRIFDDKLYLNLNMKVHKDWLASHQQFIARADAKWPAVLVLSN